MLCPAVHSPFAILQRTVVQLAPHSMSHQFLQCNVPDDTFCLRFRVTLMWFPFPKHAVSVVRSVKGLKCLICFNLTFLNISDFLVLHCKISFPLLRLCISQQYTNLVKVRAAFLLIYCIIIQL